MPRLKLTVALQIGVGLIFLLLWHVLTVYPITGTAKQVQFFFSTPLDVLKRVLDALRQRRDLAASLDHPGRDHAGLPDRRRRRHLFGFLLRARARLLAAVFDPYIKAANALPRVVLAPIFALWFGLGIWSKVALGFTLVFFIVFFNVYQGVREVSPVVLANARMLGMNERQLLRHVYWPAALTWVFSSLHTSVGFALVGAVVGEYLGSSAGLGYKIHEAESVFDVTGVFAGMLILSVFVILIDMLVTMIENRLLVWRPGQTIDARADADRKDVRLGPISQQEETTMERRTFLNSAGAAASPRLSGPNAVAQGAPEKAKLTLGVGGKPLLYYLPLTIAERKGFFKEQGLEVEINDFGGGAKSLQALIGGSVDVVTGAYEHTIRMQAKGQDVVRRDRARALPGDRRSRSKKDKAGQGQVGGRLQGAEDRRHRAGILDRAHRAIRHGEGGAEAVRCRHHRRRRGRQRGRGDEEGRDRRDLASRSGDRQARSRRRHRRSSSTPARRAGTRGALRRLEPGGDALHEEGLHRQESADHAAPRQRLREGAEMACRRQSPRTSPTSVPEEYHLGDKPLYLKAVQNSLESYSRDGIVQMSGMQSVLDMLKQLDPELKDAKVDLAATFNDRFVRQASM